MEQAQPARSGFRKVAEADFPSRFGHFRIYGFQLHTPLDVHEAVVLKMGDLMGNSAAAGPDPLAMLDRRRFP